jgi:hypothetical protein
VGGGVATFDCNDDGLPDIYLAGGSGPAALFANRSPVGGALRFERVASPVTDLDAVTGAYPLDVDGDGITDLAVLRVGESEILRGLGDCRFERANEALGLDTGNAWTAAFSATWEGANTLPTLAFGRYVNVDANGDATYTCPPNQLVRPDASGTRYAPPIDLAPSWCTLSMLFSDWSRSGRADLASRTTATTTPTRAAARSSCGGSRPMSRRGCTRRRTAGRRSGSGAWGSPARTSPATAIPRST